MTIDAFPTGDLHDFDFLAGDWTVANRRLKARWTGSDDWDEFPGTSRCTQHLGGTVNVDEIVFPTRGFAGVTVRLFDCERRCWSIYWINSHGAVLFPPVRGGFHGDRGIFFGDDVDEDQPVQVQFVWMRQGPDSARWEQAFSRDGQTWEWNWVMDFLRKPG